MALLDRPGRTRLWLTRTAAVLFVAVALVAGATSAVRADAVTTYTGTLGDGATYLIQVPVDWNGTLVLYSHGYVAPGFANPARDVGDPLTGQYLLGHGYALAGSSYATTGWAIREALPDQIATLDEFDRLVGHPATTIAWGHSLGGIITEGLVQPTRPGSTGRCRCVAAVLAASASGTRASTASSSSPACWVGEAACNSYTSTTRS